VFRRRLVGGGSEVLVAAPAASAARYGEALAVMREVEQAYARGFVVNDRANRHIDFEGGSIRAGAVAPLAVAAALSLVFGVEAEFEKGVLLLGSDQDRRRWDRPWARISPDERQDSRYRRRLPSPGFWLHR